MARAVSKLMGSKPGAPLFASATYGDLYGSSQLSAVLPTTLDSLMEVGSVDDGPLSWSWEPTGWVPDASTAAVKINAFYRHNNSNYASDIISVPLVVGKRQLALTDVYADYREYDPCYDLGNCEYEGKEKEVNLNYTLQGLREDEVASLGRSLNVLGVLLDSRSGANDAANAGDNKPVAIESIAWVQPTPARADENYLMPLPDGVAILPATIGKVQYTGYAPPPRTVLMLKGEADAMIYERDRYISSILFDTSSVGWSWNNAIMTQLIANPQDGMADYITKWYAAEFFPTGYYGEIYANSGNYRPKVDSVAIRIYKRSEDSRVDSVRVDADCGAETARITVLAANEYATIWFEETQYYDSESNQNSGTFTKTGLEYGGNNIPYRVQAQSYDQRFHNNSVIHHIRSLPFSSVAKWIRAKSLAVSLDSTLLAERTFFRKKDFDLTKTQWFRGKEKVGTGMVLSLTSDDAKEYSLVLFTKDGKEGFASCKENGLQPELPPDLQWVPVNNVPKLIASSFGSRVVAGGSSLTFNTPDGGTISIYTMKGELISKMSAVENRTVVKVPPTHGMYIVKLEAR
jgi:hypothetical protein